MLNDRLEAIEAKQDLILGFFECIPYWIPLTYQVALDLGYKSIEGLRKKMFTTLEPDSDYRQIGRLWHVRKHVIVLLKRGKGC